MLSEEQRKQRRRLSQAKAKVKQFEAKARRAELRAAYWRRKVADCQFEQSSAFQAHLWPAAEGAQAGPHEPRAEAPDRNAELGNRPDYSGSPIGVEQNLER